MFSFRATTAARLSQHPTCWCDCGQLPPPCRCRDGRRWHWQEHRSEASGKRQRCGVPLRGHYLPLGLVTNSIPFHVDVVIQSRIISVFSTNAKSRFASDVFDSVLGSLCLTRNTWHCLWLSVVPEQRKRWVEGLVWRAPCQLTKPFKCPRWRRGSCFHKKKIEKIALVARPGCHGPRRHVKFGVATLNQLELGLSL